MSFRLKREPHVGRFPTRSYRLALDRLIRLCVVPCFCEGARARWKPLCGLLYRRSHAKREDMRLRCTCARLFSGAAEVARTQQVGRLQAMVLSLHRLTATNLKTRALSFHFVF